MYFNCADFYRLRIVPVIVTVRLHTSFKINVHFILFYNFGSNLSQEIQLNLHPRRLDVAPHPPVNMCVYDYHRLLGWYTRACGLERFWIMQ